MGMTALDKMNINKYLKDHAIGDIYYGNMCEALGRRKGKVSDIDFLDYFTEYVVNEFRKDEKISTNHVTKVVSVVTAFVGWLHEEGKEISEEILDKIRSFKEFYDDYLKRTGLEEDTILSDGYIKAAMDKVNELYPSEVVSESVSKYINKVAELEKQIKKLEKDLGDVTRLYDNLQDSCTQKSDKVEELKGEIDSLKRDVRTKNKDILSLNGIIEELNTKISELESALTDAHGEKAELTPFREAYNLLDEEVAKLKKVIEDEIAVKKAAAQLENKQSRIEALMYEKLLFERVNVDDLIKYIEKRGIETDRSEVSRLLNRMSKVVNIDGNTFTTQPNYKIVSPTITEDGNFTIEVPAGCKHYDVMLVSDFHIREVNDKVEKGYCLLAEYCVNNNINLVLNLGDFYNGSASYWPIDYENAVKNYELIQQTISKLPHVPGLYHGVLGGNHDKHILGYGYDPIATLVDGRDDFINLGYTHSTISINSPTNYLGCFDIHHPDSFDFRVELDENGSDVHGVNSYLEDVYAKQERSRDESYIDVFGHTHRSQFNYPGGYCYIPAYYNTNNNNSVGNTKGACHLRIYFDEETDIKYMVFMPLTYNLNTKLNKTNEIVYQKVLKK